MNIDMIELPVFFESARETPTLVIGQKVYEARRKVDKPTGDLLLIDNNKLEFTEIESLDTFDRRYFEKIGLEKILFDECKRREIEAESELKKTMNLLKSSSILFFIENYVFKWLRGTKESKENNHVDGYNLLKEKLTEKQRQNKFSVLSNLFGQGLYLIIGDMVEILEQTDRPSKVHVKIVPNEYNPRPLCSLESLKEMYRKRFKQIIESEIEVVTQKIGKIRRDVERYKRLTSDKVIEGDFGFVRIQDRYYIVGKVCPHAYRLEGNYYFFDETWLGVPVPESNEVTIYTCGPVALDDLYKHPSLPDYGNLRSVCYKGRNDPRGIELIKSRFEDYIKKIKSREDGKKLTVLDEKALKLIYILKVLGLFTMEEGYMDSFIDEHGDVQSGNPYTRLKNNYTPHTESECNAWASKKQAEGHAVRVRIIG